MESNGPVRIPEDEEDKSQSIPFDTAQAEAITADYNVPLMIIASPGSGKTTTLCNRVKGMIGTFQPKIVRE